MKISELIALLEQRKEECGDISVAKYNYNTLTVTPVNGVNVYWDEDDQPYVKIV